MRVVCADCRRVMHVEQNGVTVREREARFCQDGDIYACPTCFTRVIIADGQGRIEVTPVVGATYYDLKPSL